MSYLTKQLFLHEALADLPPRPQTAHKGDFGHVLIVGGDYGMPGAVRMAGEAALRVGAGLVTLATRPEHAFPIGSSPTPELMAHGIEKAQDLDSLLKKATVIVLGPGLGQSSWSKHLFTHTLDFVQKIEKTEMKGKTETKETTEKTEKSKTPIPIVIDADALKLLATNPSKPHPHSHPWILTPHPGEAAELLNTTSASIQSDRPKSIQKLHEKYHSVIVLKGAGSLVLGDSKTIFHCEAGNPGMASAGMGDILSGIIAGLLAQGLSPEKAACLGVIAHATAGDYAAKEEGERGLKATDLLTYLRRCINP